MAGLQRRIIENILTQPQLAVHSVSFMPTKTTMSPPVYLSLPSPEPQPVDGCGVCRALVGQRAEARGRGDLSRVTDLNVELRSHHDGAGQ